MRGVLKSQGRAAGLTRRMGGERTFFIPNVCSKLACHILMLEPLIHTLSTLAFAAFGWSFPLGGMA